ncbi:unnamed protein product, partial [marine sediment metagenome]
HRQQKFVAEENLLYGPFVIQDIEKMGNEQGQKEKLAAILRGCRQSRKEPGKNVK